MSDGRPEMTPEQVEALLRELGVEPGQWSSTPEHLAGSIMGKRPEVLLRLRDLLEQFEARDKATVAHLRERLTRLQHGGGS